VCLAIPGQVVSIHADQPLLARVEVGGVQRNVNVGLLEEGVVTGDWILIHVGFALSKIDAEQAEDQLRMLRAMGEDALAIEEVRGYSFADESAETKVLVPSQGSSKEPASAGSGGIGGLRRPDVQ
jgi:hydrogenase expression/formation protein HypC